MAPQQAAGLLRSYDTADSPACINNVQYAGNTLAFTIWNLARCPDKAAKLCAEIDAAPDQAATLDSLESLPYMDAVLRESLRLFPPLPVALRDAAKDQVVGGVY